MKANARMYSPIPAIAKLWRELFARLLEDGEALEWLEYPAPQALHDLWRRADNGAVFMCGLPFSGGDYPVQALAAPIPAEAGYHGMPQYWSDFVVSTESRFERLEDTFGSRIAFTAPDSQSGFAAALEHLMPLSAHAPLYQEIVGPTITPQGNIAAVLEGRADVAPIDSYALDLLRRYQPELTARLRIVARSRLTANPLLVASKTQDAGRVRSALLLAHTRPELQELLAALLLKGFAAVGTGPYQKLQQRFDDARRSFQTRALAQRENPAFV